MIDDFSWLGAQRGKLFRPRAVVLEGLSHDLSSGNFQTTKNLGPEI